MCIPQCLSVNPSVTWSDTRFRTASGDAMTKLRRFPDGPLVCGDAVCSLNPIYGQGMSVAAMDALALRDCLRRGRADLPRRYFRAAAKSIGTAWSLRSGLDLRFPEVQGRRTPLARLTNAYGDWMLSACATDTTVLTQFFRVTGFVDPPARLVSPSFVFRTARAHLRPTRVLHPQTNQLP